MSPLFTYTCLGALVASVTLVSCKSSARVEAQNGPNTVAWQADLPQSIIRGTIAEVLAVDSLAAPPCNAVACSALVTIEQVLKYGAGGGEVFQPGGVIRVQFGYTMGATETLFPKLSPPYPGLAAGVSFEAPVHVKMKSAPEYTIYHYVKIS